MTKKRSKAQILQLSAFIVAITRYMGLGGMAVNHNIFGHTVFVWLEIVSWAGLAVLEAYAISYIAKGMSKFPARSFNWWQLITYRAALLLAIPLLGAPLYAAVSYDMQVFEILPPVLYWGWLFLLAGLVALIADGVGTVEAIEDEAETTPVKMQVLNAATEAGSVSAKQIAKMTGLPIAVVDDELSAVARLFSVNGSGK